MLVSRVQSEVVLQDKSRQPHIVCWNRCALFSELAEQRVKMNPATLDWMGPACSRRFVMSCAPPQMGDVQARSWCFISTSRGIVIPNR